MGKRTTVRTHNSRGYRSGLEEEATAFLTPRQKIVKYEQLKIEWEDLRYRKYTPDFELDNGIIVETKGFFDSEDRRKHLAIKSQHPELDIRFVFSNANAKLYKGAKTRYFEWCDKNGFLWAHRTIPEVWLTEPGSRAKTDKIPLKTQRKD
jgi:hypothetical protein